MAGYLANNLGIVDVKTSDFFWIVTGRASTSRDATDLRQIANALRESDYVSHRLNTGFVWIYHAVNPVSSQSESTLQTMKRCS